MGELCLADIPAVILAGGLGTRLRAALADRPKVLAPVNGRPFLVYLLDQLGRAGVQKVVLCTGHMAHMVRDALGENYQGISLLYSRETAPLGTGGALGLAAPLLEAHTALVLNGDSYCQADLPAFYGQHAASGAAASILLAQVADTSRYGRVETGPDGRVSAFGEKDGHSGPGLINAGIYLLAKRLIENIPSQGPVSLERDLMPVWLAEGVWSHAVQGRFIDIGTPESFRQAEEFFRD